MDAKYEEVKKGIVKRSSRRVIGLFIDGVGLDRATRRLNRKVDLAALVRGVTSGLEPIVARYYTLIPFEDDSRQRAFLDAVSRANLQVVVKRLPPKGINRQVSIDVEMASDMVAFARGHSDFSALSEYSTEESYEGGAIPTAMPFLNKPTETKPESEPSKAPSANNVPESRIVTVVCPSRDLSYPLALIKDLKIDTVAADFGQFSSNEIIKAAAKWIDLSDSETIWRE